MSGCFFLKHGVGLLTMTISHSNNCDETFCGAKSSVWITFDGTHPRPGGLSARIESSWVCTVSRASNVANGLQTQSAPML